jgi:choline dehydrogenase-like flavoprotein
MLVDFRDAEEGSEIDADLCIVGGGAAGITLAAALSGTSLDVCLIESGGFEYEPRTQALYEGTAIGVPWRTDMQECRLRYFGGSTNAWGGGCAPLDDIDFEVRPWVPYSGWPIAKAALAPYYERARSICRIAAHRFDDEALLDAVLGQLTRAPLRFDPDALVDRFYLRSPIRFGEAYRAELEQAANVTVLVHANLTELAVDDGGRAVHRALIRTVEGKCGTVRARGFVLACGGIENARVLLASNSVVPNGLGNDHDLVGRFFMDHPSGRCGVIESDDPDRLLRPYDHGTYYDRDIPLFPVLCLSEAAQQREGLLNARCRITDSETGEIPDGIRAVRELRLAYRTGQDWSDILGMARRIVVDFGRVAPAVYRRAAGGAVIRSHRVDLNGVFEQAPNPDSRIELSDERDALGQRKVRLDWRLTELDRRTYRATARLFDGELRRQSFGRLRFEEWFERANDDGLPEVGGVAHHLGTTRMSEDPRQGVVDRECRVHGTANLYIAGGSVFPTGGWKGPTFTIVALALRLADHLKVKLSQAALAPM